MRLEEHLAGHEDDLRNLILQIGETCKTIAAGFAARQGQSDTQNVYGETQMALDKWADSVLIEDLRKSGLVRYLASEEQPDVLVFGDALDGKQPSEDAGGGLGITLDPLDGSSLIGVNLAVGTIVGIYRGNVLRPGRDMVGAMYVLYGPLTTLTYTLKKGVHEFVLDPDGQYILQEADIRIPEGKIYAPGALRKQYLPGHLEWIETLEADGYKVRFSGSFVADVHQILHKGGVFTYPGFEGRERGKLRLLFEGNPMGFIVEEAGGASSDGSVSLLDIKPTGVADRVPVYIGGKKEIDMIEKINSRI